MSGSQFNWLTAEDILNAAQDSEYKITHSPIVLIPYEEDIQAESYDNVELGTIQNDLVTKNFAIIDTLSNQLIEGNEVGDKFKSDERV